MTWTLEQVTTQTGRVAIVTGANIGLGFEIAMALAGRGCTVVLACRNAEKAEAAKQRIVSTHRNAVVECMPLDLSSLQSVRAFANAFRKHHLRLDLLINNAGIMMPPYSLTEDGFESQLAANYLGHFALTGLLMPLITETPGRAWSASAVSRIDGAAYGLTILIFHVSTTRARPMLKVSLPASCLPMSCNGDCATPETLRSRLQRIRVYLRLTFSNICRKSRGFSRRSCQSCFSPPKTARNRSFMPRWEPTSTAAITSDQNQWAKCAAHQ